MQKLYLSKADCENLKDKRILIVDDVISTGESLAAMEELLHTIGGQVVGKACVLAEGDAKDRTDIIYPGAPAPVLQVKRWCGPSPWWGFLAMARWCSARRWDPGPPGPWRCCAWVCLCHAGLPRLLGICRPAQGAAHMARAFGCVSEGSCPFQGLFWVAAALAVAGGLCGMLAFRWQQAEPVQALAGEKRTLRAQVLDYPQALPHRYYYRLQVKPWAKRAGRWRRWGPSPCGFAPPCL